MIIMIERGVVFEGSNPDMLAAVALFDLILVVWKTTPPPPLKEGFISSIEGYA